MSYYNSVFLYTLEFNVVIEGKFLLPHPRNIIISGLGCSKFVAPSINLRHVTVQIHSR
jgi:hypothetical protein